MAKLSLRSTVLNSKSKTAVFSCPEIEGNISPNDRNGFTLIELLVSIAIIGILTAIILPGVFYGLRAAKTSACAANLSQLGIATLSYARDNDGMFPPYTFNSYTPVVIVSTAKSDEETDDFKLSIKAYGVAEAQWFCPLDPFAHHMPFGVDFLFNPAKSSYTVGLPIRDWPGMHRPIAAESMLPSTSDYLLYTDSPLFKEPPQGCYDTAAKIVAGHEVRNEVCETPHGWKANTVFFDGHVKLAPAAEDFDEQFQWPD